MKKIDSVQEIYDEILDYLQFHILIYSLRDWCYTKMGYYVANMKQLTEDVQEHIQMASVFILEVMISF